MTASATPYRAKPRGRTVALAVYPLLPMRLLVVVGVLIVIVSSLHLFLWSRVVHIRCERAADQVPCVVNESSLVLSKRSERDARHATRAELAGAVSRSRGDTWIVVIEGPARFALTSGFSGDKAGQRAAAEELTTFFRGTARSVEVTYGSRWQTAWILVVLFGALFVLTYPFFGYRVRVMIDRGEGTLVIHRGPWPFALGLAGYRSPSSLASPSRVICGSGSS